MIRNGPDNYPFNDMFSIKQEQNTKTAERYNVQDEPDSVSHFDVFKQCFSERVLCIKYGKQ
jgi:hypothetical protein